MNPECEDGPNFRAAALNAFDLPDAAITEDKQVIMPWANRILPAAMLAHNIPAEEEDTASVISVASSGAAAQKRATETDSDASQASKDDAQTEVGSVEEVPTDEDESEPESEEEFELSEKEQRLLHEAYDTYATTGQQWTRERQSSSANCRTSFADAGNVRSVVEKLTDLPDSWPLMRILIPLDGLSLQIERIIACVAAELSATHLEAKTLGKFVKRVAKKLTAMLACYLAGEVALNSLSGRRNWTSRNGCTHVSSAPHSSFLGKAHIYGASARLVKAPERHKSRNGATVNRAGEDPVHPQSPKRRTDECHPT